MTEIVNPILALIIWGIAILIVIAGISGVMMLRRGWRSAFAYLLTGCLLLLGLSALLASIVVRGA